MERLSNFFFPIFFFISPKNGASEEATIFLKLISRKNVASEEAIFFFKQRNITLTWTVILRLGKKNWYLQKNEAAK